MKHLKFPVFFLLFSVSSFAQDVIIPDYKGDKESLSKMKDKTIRREVATFTEAGSEEPKSNITLKEIPLTKFGSNYSIFEGDSISITLRKGNFIKANHKIKYIGNYAAKIDDKPIWGTDGELPKTQINSIIVKNGVDTVVIPNSAYMDLFEPSLAWKETNKTVGGLAVYRSNDRSRFYIAMSNGDGAGFYEATFIIKNKKYFGRVLDTGF